MDIKWDKPTEEKFNLMINTKIPIFLRSIAQGKVSQKAESFAQKDNRLIVTEKDLIDALFAETPFGFHGPMKTDMKDLGLDYTKYGYDK